MSYTPFEKYFKNCAKSYGKGYLFDSFEHIKKHVISLTESNKTCFFWHDYKLRNHPERIINIIYEVISPFLEKKKLILSVDEQYVLLCSAYLHDLVKFFPNLRIRSLSEKEPLKIYQIKEIEKFHDFDIFRIFMFYTHPGYYSEHNPALEKSSFDLSSVNTLHKFFRDLTNAEERKILIESIAIISGFHKSLTIEAEDAMKDRMKKFLICDKSREKADTEGERRADWGKLFGTLEKVLDSIGKKQIKIDLLAALLKLGDCFDISEERINKDMIKDVELGLAKRDDWNVLAKWYQFYIVKKIDVVHENNGNVDIVIEYCIPPALNKKEFCKLTFFRKLAETDFEDLTYLKVIEYYLFKSETVLLDSSNLTGFIINKYKYESNENEKNSTTISAKYRVIREKKGNIIENVLEYIDNSLKEDTDKFEEEKKKLKVFEPIKSFEIFPGYEDSPKIAFPASKEVLFTLSFFDRYPSQQFSTDEIGHKTGLNSTQIQSACESLAKSNIIEKDEKDPTKFKMREGEQRKELKQIMKEYQRNPYNLKIKTWEIKKFGKILPLENITKGDITPTGILGLDKILSDKGDASKGGIKADQCILIKGAPGTGKTTLAVQLLLNKKGLNCLYLTFEEDLKQLKENFKDFRFDLDSIKFVTLAGLLSRKTPGSNFSGQIFDFLTKEIDDNNPDILVVDSITRFREFTNRKDVRTSLSDFMSILKIRHITSFFIGEDVERYDFEDYLVDGIIKLGYQEGKRSLEILKLRGQDFAPGVHSYNFFDEKKILSELKDFYLFSWDDILRKEYQRLIDFLKHDYDIEVIEGIDKIEPENIEKIDKIRAINVRTKDKSLSLSINDEKTRVKLEIDDGRTDELIAMMENGKLNIYKDLSIKPGINVYPNLNTYLREKIEKTNNISPKPISSGTKGLDELLPIDEQKDGLMDGEFILVAGSPGSGKTLIGLQFLGEGERNKEKGSLWISFEGGLNELKKSIGDIEPLMKMTENRNYFKFKYFAPFNINLDEFVYIINRNLESGVKRIVIDSISDLIAAFEDKLKFKNFVNSFLQVLHNHGATTMLLYRVPNFFGSPETLGIEVTSVVDTILLLKNVEVHNKIEKGVFVLKIRGRKHKSEIRSVITSKDGLEIKKLGWHMEGLLSGTVGQIHEPEVFIKLFYENEAESEKNRKGADEFQKRYPTGRVQVKIVRKPEIHIDVWSFREERGPSHSNVKIVSVKQYWAIGFLEGERLHPLAEYIPGETKLEKEDDRFWKECLAASKTNGKNDMHNSIHLIPYYADINVLTYRKDVFNDICNGETDILKIVKEKYTTIEIKNYLLTFDNLIDLAKLVMSDISKKSKKDKNGLSGGELQYYFAMPYLFDKSSFMTFFLEVLWAYGGNIFRIPEDMSFKDGRNIKKEDATPHDLRRYILEYPDSLVINGKEAIEALEKLRKWVFEETFSPNPFQGNFSDKALFSMQWYSKIKDTIKKNRDIICVAAPPTGPNSDKGYMTYDLCCLALIKGAIAPEMGWLFIDTLASTKNMEEMADEKLGLPATEKAYYNKKFVEYDKEANGIVKDFILEKKDNYELKTLSRIPFYYKIEGMIHNEITNVFHPDPNKRIEVKDALKKAYDNINKFLEIKKQNEKI